MRRLHGADHYHLYVESAVQHQHTLKVLLFDRSATQGPVDVAWLRRWAEVAAAECAPLRWRLHPATGGPAWVDAADIDLDHHVRSCDARPPGDREALGSVVARLKSTKLDRDRPLWQLWLVDGLADGRAAVIWVLHHALADGGETVRLLDHLHGPPSTTGEGPVRAGPAGPPPSRASAMVGSVRAVSRRATSLPGVAARSLRSVSAAGQRRRAGEPGAARPFSAPATPFGRGVTAGRVCASASVPMADVAEVRAAFGVTVNDVFLAVVAGAVSAYLDGRGERPDRVLTACVPVSIRTEAEVGSLGNRLSTWFVPLATDLTDPVDRLRAVSRGARRARAEREATSSAPLQQEWMAYPSLFRRYVQLGETSTRRAGRPPYSLIASCVRGPVSLQVAGAPVEEIQSYSQLAAGIGLNVTAWSYRDRLTAGLVACPEHVPDVWDLADRVAPALEDLVLSARSEALEPAS